MYVCGVVVRPSGLCVFVCIFVCKCVCVAACMFVCMPLSVSLSVGRRSDGLCLPVCPCGCMCACMYIWCLVSLLVCAFLCCIAVGMSPYAVDAAGLSVCAPYHQTNKRRWWAEGRHMTNRSDGRSAGRSVTACPYVWVHANLYIGLYVCLCVCLYLFACRSAGGQSVSVCSSARFRVCVSACGFVSRYLYMYLLLLF